MLKSHVRKDLLDTIRAVNAGQKKIDLEVAVELAGHTADDALTEREIEVLALIAAGNSNKLIADQLSITEDTTKSHVKNIMAKLGANDRTHAVTLALQRGIVELESNVVLTLDGRSLPSSPVSARPRIKPKSS